MRNATLVDMQMNERRLELFDSIGVSASKIPWGYAATVDKRGRLVTTLKGDDCISATTHAQAFNLMTGVIIDLSAEYTGEEYLIQRINYSFLVQSRDGSRKALEIDGYPKFMETSELRTIARSLSRIARITSTLDT